MKILLTSLYYYPKVGGVENSLRYIAKELKQLGYNVAVMSFDNNEIGKIVEIIDGITVFRFHFITHRIPSIRYSRLIKSAQRAIEEVLVDFEADQIWSRNTIVAAGLAKSKKVNLVKHIFSTTTHLNIEGLYTNIKKEPPFKRLSLSILKKIDALALSKIDTIVLSSRKVISVVFSEMMCRQLRAEHNMKNPIYVINPGVDTSIFNNDPTSHDFEDAIKKFPVLDQKYILYVGRIAPAKNLEILIDSLKSLKNVKLLIVGDGAENYANHIKNLVRKSNLEEKVVFVGRQSDMLPIIYSMAKITVLPTRIETFGQVLIESLSCGTPVIGFGNNQGFNTAVDEIITNEDNGEIVDRYDSIYLAKAIFSLLEKIATNENNIRKNNIEYVKNKYNWENTVKEILRLSL